MSVPIIPGSGLYVFLDRYNAAIKLYLSLSWLIDARIGLSNVGCGIDIRYHFDMYHGGSIDSYNYIRLLSCHSAEDLYLLGQQIANTFNNETKAFSSRVISIHPSFLIDAPIHLGGYIFNNINHFIAATGKSVLRY